jgi:hypothetical protein
VDPNHTDAQMQCLNILSNKTPLLKKKNLPSEYVFSIYICSPAKLGNLPTSTCEFLAFQGTPFLGAAYCEASCALLNTSRIFVCNQMCSQPFEATRAVNISPLMKE